MNPTPSLCETQRLDVLRAYDILDTGAEEMFDELTKLAAEICAVPISLVSLVDENRQWFKSKVGVEVSETPRSWAFCAYALEGTEMLVVPDALQDARFAQNPLVTGEPHIRFYAGTPLRTPEGAVLGTLCVIDRVPRELTTEQQAALAVLGRQVMRLMLMRHSVMELQHLREEEEHIRLERELTLAALRKSEEEQRRLAQRLEAAQEAGGIGSWVVDLRTFQAEWSEQTHYVFGTDPQTTPECYASFEERVHPEDVEVVNEIFRQSIEECLPRVYIHRMVMRDGRVRHIEQRWQAMRDGNGEPYQAIGTSQDVTERILAEHRLQRLNRLYAISSGINAAIVRMTNTQQLYEEACRIAVEEGGLLMACVGVADVASQRLVPVASHGCEDGYLENANVSLEEVPRGLGPSGRAYRENEAVFCQDIATDPMMEPWRQAALERGYHACACFPLRVEGRPIGIFAVYGDASHYFSTDECQFLNAIAENLSYAVESRQREQQRRQAEQALKASEERFSSFMAHSPVAGWIVDEECRYHYVSPGYYRVFDTLGRNDLTGLTALEVFGPELTEAYQSRNRQVLEEQRAITRVMPGRRVDGTQGEFHVVCFPILTPGQAPMIGGLAMDVTEQRRAEQTLRDSEASFRSYFELSLHGIAVTTPEKGWVQVNDRLCSILGYEREELMKLSWPELTHPEDLPADQHQFEQLLAGTIQSYEMEKRFIRKDGRVVWASIGVGCVRNADGSIAHIIGVVLDIDERKHAEQILREQATLLDSAQDAIMVRDLQDRILYWNKSCERLYGWTASEAMGRAAEELLYRDATEFHVAWEQSMTKGEWVGELQQWTKDGRPLTIQGRWTLIRQENGRPKSLLCINTDITGRRQLEQQFLRAQRMESIGTLAGGIAHDLNNVLAPIMMSIDVLRLRETNPQRLEMLETIEGSARRGADMVQQVLSFARGVVGQNLEVHLGHLIDEIIKIVNETFMQHIHAQQDVAADLWMVKGDPTQLHQVLLNLCVNARDAMRAGGTITISAKNVMLDEQYTSMNIEATTGPHVQVTVADTGTGMPPEVVERIFEPFFTTKEVGKGTGLGLSTTLSIIKHHGGFIRVQSEPGRGTNFSLYLPAQTSTAAGTDSPGPSMLPQGNGELVLVVDDEEAVREITRHTLETFGYQVVVANHGVDAIALYSSQKEQVAAILMDLMMPVMDGPTAIQVLRHMSPGLPIIAASGISTEHHVARASSAGATRFLPKPYTAETLLNALKGALN
ncbi:PAS domain S-box protein [Prosthecobacter vanneervenii]|uniref:histidine kinase n=1 Tax=Prosthecobacter vanneervenii TaxID=48466 RepID=A0A7W8DM71_9BACT|nr:PAS domain S-box protein [Prosthecobacter vanneervenii]MBB5034596.1 PAS domain S-box-containing protein [Prosthecobacter vanneervenii]